MFLIVSKYLIPKGYAAITFFPFIVLKHKNYLKSKTIINHEKIHIRQQLELLILPFYLLYAANYLYNCLKYKNVESAYRNICFEREAYENEKNLNYIKSRSFWNFFRYLY